LGCGYSEIAQYFGNHSRFKFHNFDHVSSSPIIIERDIRDTGLNDYSVDIAILSLAMWGSNCNDYLSEIYRILDTGSKLLIIEPYKRWYDIEKDENRLILQLEKEGFRIDNTIEKKFMFIIASK